MTEAQALDRMRTIPKAAEEMNVSYSRLYRLVRAKKVPSYEIAGMTMVSMDDLAARVSIPACLLDADQLAASTPLEPVPVGATA